MKPSEQKQLAEKVAKFLGLKRANHKEWNFEFDGKPWLICEDNFFESDFAPILMHLGKREMEKRGYECVYRTHERSIDPNERDYLHSYSFAMHKPIQSNKNEFIAFWKAVEQTGEMEE